jgi:hypothetical protein
MKQFYFTCLSIIMGNLSLNAQIVLKPKYFSAYFSINSLYTMPDIETGYSEFNIAPQFGYYLTRNVAVGGEYVYLRAGRQDWPDSIYHFAAIFIDYSVFSKNKKAGLSVKTLGGIGNYCSCSTTNLNDNIDPYRTDHLLYYLGYDFTGMLKVYKNMYASISVHHLLPMNHRAPYRYASIRGLLGLRWQIPIK